MNTKEQAVMDGLVLWYSETARMAMIWCEDQGPLAFLGPEVALPTGIDELSSGDRLTFSIEMRDGVRYVHEVSTYEPGLVSTDPKEIIRGFHNMQDAARHLRVVA
jgi:hypothetical protein